MQWGSHESTPFVWQPYGSTDVTLHTEENPENNPPHDISCLTSQTLQWAETLAQAVAVPASTYSSLPHAQFLSCAYFWQQLTRF